LRLRFPEFASVKLLPEFIGGHFAFRVNSNGFDRFHLADHVHPKVMFSGVKNKVFNFIPCNGERSETGEWSHQRISRGIPFNGERSETPVFGITSDRNGIPLNTEMSLIFISPKMARFINGIPSRGDRSASSRLPKVRFVSGMFLSGERLLRGVP